MYFIFLITIIIQNLLRKQLFINCLITYMNKLCTKNDRCEACYRPTEFCNGDKYTKAFIFKQDVLNTPVGILYNTRIFYSKSFMEYWIINALNRNYWRNF